MHNSNGNAQDKSRARVEAMGAALDEIRKSATPAQQQEAILTRLDSLARQVAAIAARLDRAEDREGERDAIANVAKRAALQGRAGIGRVEDLLAAAFAAGGRR